MDRGLRILVLTLLVASPRLVFAQTVLLVAPPATDAILFEAYGRLRAELELQAFQVSSLEATSARNQPDELEREAQSRNAVAAIALRRSENETMADVLIVDRFTGKSSSRKLLIEDPPNGPTLLATRSADLLRASLTEYAPGEHPPKDVMGVANAPPLPAVTRFTEQIRSFRLRAGGVALWAPSIGYALGPEVAAAYLFDGRYTLEFSLSGPLVGAQFDATYGKATIRQEFALIHAGWNFAQKTAVPTWEWGPRIGTGIYHLAATSTVEEPLVARTDSLWSFATSMGLEARLFFVPTVSATLDAEALALFPRPRIALAEERSAAIPVQAHVAATLDVAF